MNSLTFRVIFLFSILFSCSNLYGQPSEIAGKVIDISTNEAIPMVNVYFKGTTIGTVTGNNGEFLLQGLSASDTLVCSSVGYITQELGIRGLEMPLIIKLKAKKIDLNEVSVRPDDSRVRWILKQLNKNKSSNNPEKHQRYAYEKYTKWEYSIANVDSAFMNMPSFKDHQTFFKRKKDGSRYLPVYLSEQIVQNKVQRSPLKQQSTMVADKKEGLGVLGEYEVGGYTTGLDFEYNFYTNYVKVFDENFVSPAASNGWFYYNYYIQDSTVVNDCKHFNILFVPKRKHDKVFRGTMLVEDCRFSLVKVEASLSSKTNVNFLKEMDLDISYQFVDGKYPFYKEQRVNASFDYLPFDIGSSKREMGLDFRQYSSYSNVNTQLDEPFDLSSKALSYESIKLRGAKNRDDDFWEQARHINLESSDKENYAVIDSINNIPLVKALDNTARMVMTGYFDVGKIELGPYMDLMQANKIEGLRLFAGGRTSSEISTDWMLWGGLGYGTRTQRVTGALGAGYKFDSPKRKVVKLSYDDRYIRLGENKKILYLYENKLTVSQNNLVSAFFVRDEFNELQRQQNVTLNYEHELRTGLSSSLNIDYRKQYSPEYYPFVYNGSAISHINVFEASIDFRLSFKEKVLDDDFMRLYVHTNHPILNLSFTQGRATFGNEELNYSKVHATIKHRFNLGQTTFRYALEGGAIFGKVPFTLLEIPRGNETYGYYNYDFNMVDYLEFAHDSYLHLYTDYHLNGFIFNRLPLFKNLGLREVISAKAMVGSLSAKQYDTIEMPESISALSQPYFEVGAGLENIIRLFRVEAIWRVNPESITGAPNFGIRAKFELSL